MMIVTTNLALLYNIPHCYLISFLYFGYFSSVSALSDFEAPKATGTNDSRAPLSPYITAKASTLMSMLPMPTPAIKIGSFECPMK